MSDQNNEANGGNETEANNGATETPATETQATETVAGGEGSDTVQSGEGDNSDGAPPMKPEGYDHGQDATQSEAQSDPNGQGAAREEEAAAIAAAASNIKVTFTGAGSATVEVASGTKAGDALKAAKLDGRLMMRSANNEVINRTKELTEDVTITTVSPATGG